MSKQIFVSGIGTEVGKTVVSAALVEHLKADYWKPVQSGDLDYTDSMKVQEWISNEHTTIHPETFKLNTPASPHLSARLDGVEIRKEDFQLPQTENNLVVEGAGGLLVPLSTKELIVDLIAHLQLPVVLVVRNYLGSINHTLLSIEALKQRNIPLLGLIYSGNKNAESEAIIAEFSGVRCLGYLPEYDAVNPANIKDAAACLNGMSL